MGNGLGVGPEYARADLRLLRELRLFRRPVVLADLVLAVANSLLLHGRPSCRPSTRIAVVCGGVFVAAAAAARVAVVVSRAVLSSVSVFGDDDDTAGAFVVVFLRRRERHALASTVLTYMPDPLDSL